ncbi:hypothetical protein [Rhodococcus sp. Eu-32]|uniref:glycine-rich domain-containing protein n=1 Tax=Rhodococcus sp. Eu-32 TaxID=1017319 RepID=UPI00140214F9|nr:hypothetical protein [Rhodococcus sp. Eu-32]
MTSPDHSTGTQPNTGWSDVSEMATDFTKNGLIGILFGGFANGLAGFISSLVGGIFGGTGGGGLGDLIGGLLGVKNKVNHVADVEIPRVDNRIDELAGGVTQFTFAQSGTFTKPTGATRIQVTLIGGGAGGARYQRTVNPGGGSGGWTKWYEFLAAEVPSSVAVTVGPGGGGGISDGSLGASGGASAFGSLLNVGGGRCQPSGAIPGFGTELYYNGSGGKGYSESGDGARPGGNGPFSPGGAAGTTSSKNGENGVPAPEGLIGPGSGGGGGESVSGASGNGGHGGYPGGGGGGGANYNFAGTIGNGGNGAAGLVVVRVYFN